jgi:hypothetical protein
MDGREEALGGVVLGLFENESGRGKETGVCGGSAVVVCEVRKIVGWRRRVSTEW